MISLFTGRRRVLSFPKKWANAVVRWIAGIHSPSGTIRVKNTMSPGEDGSLQLDVDVDAVAKETLARVDTRPITQKERDRFDTHLRGKIDGNSITMKGAHIGVSDEWVENKCREYAKENPGEGPDAPPSTTSMDSGFSGIISGYQSLAGGTFTAGAPGGAGTKVKLLCRGADGGVNGMLFWREFTITSDGRIYAIAAENSGDTMGVYTDQ